MRTIIIALCMVLAAVSPGFQSKAQTGCKPNPQSKDYTGVSRLEDYTNNHVWSELFTLPSGVSGYASTDLAEQGLTFTCDNSNPNLVLVENCGYDATLTSRKNQLRYRVYADKSGEALLSVHCTYEGVTTTKEIKITVTEAGDNPFIPKNPSPYNMNGLRPTSQIKRNTAVSNFFTLPPGWNDVKKWEEWGITWGFTVSNPELISKVEPKVQGTTAQVDLTFEPITGESDITCWIERNGVRKESTYHSSMYGVRCSDDEAAVLRIDEPTQIDVLSNDKKLSGVDFSITFVRQPEHGTVEIGESVDKNNKPITVVNYTPTDAANIPNWTPDSFRYRCTLEEGKGEDNEYSEAEVTLVIRNNPAIARIHEFVPAPGQFINTARFLGADAKALVGKGGGAGSSSTPATTGLISLGSFGGYVVFSFDEPVKNDPRNPYGVDFIISGNAFKADAKGYWSEPGAVMVMRDDNGDGEPNDTWYELAGSDYWFKTTRRNVTFTYEDPQYTGRHAVPYTTSDGDARAMASNMFHQQSYFPDPVNYPDVKLVDGKLSLTGNHIKGVYDRRTPSYIESYRAFPFGYADNHATTGDLTVARNPYYAENGEDPTDGFDISWAVDKDGNYVELDEIHFVKVYNAVSEVCGWLGESSTEIGGACIARADLDQTAPGDYYINYANIVQLQVPVGHTCEYEGFAFHNGRPMRELKGTWTSSDPEVGVFDADGVFTAKKVGFTNVTFQATDKAPADKFEIEVVTLAKVVIDREGNASETSNEKMECFVGERDWINVESETSNVDELNGTKNNRYVYDTYKWTSSDPSVVECGDTGFFTAKAGGKCTLTATSQTDPTLSASIEVTVKELPQPEKYNNYLVIEDQNLTQETLNSKVFSCADLFSAGGRVVNISLTSVEPKEYAENFYVKNNRLYNRLTKGDYREYRLAFEGELNGVTVPIEVPVLHTTTYNTIMPQEVFAPEAIVLDRNTRTNSIDLATVFPISGQPELYKAEYKLNNVHESLTATLEGSVLTITTEETTLPEDATVTVQGRISRATQRATKAAAPASVPVAAKWETVTVPVLISGTQTAINEIIADKDGAPVKIYNLDGVRFNCLPSAPGIYIIKKGSEVYKIIK